MARKKSKLYKMIKTGTEDMGTSGDQQYLGRVETLDASVGAAFVNNVIVSCQVNYEEAGTVPAAFTIYLSKAGSTGAGGGGWNDDDVITARATGNGGGTVNLVAKRRIQTNIFGSVSAEDIGPVHIWAEVTDMPQSDQSCRFTIEAWGYFHTLVSDLS